jgi:hypothetical protein
MSPTETFAPGPNSRIAAQDASTETPKARRILFATFLFLGVLDVFAWRGLVVTHAPDPKSVSKVVFEGDAAAFRVENVAWQYPMLPQPSFTDDHTLAVPPGYPIAFMRSDTLRGLEIELYESRTPAMILVERDSMGALAFLGVDESGAPHVRATADGPPSIAEILALASCFDETDVLRFSVTLDATVRITGGRCTWEVASSTGRVIVDSPDSSSHIEATSGSHFATFDMRLWLLVLLFAASMLHRAPFMNTRFIGTDGTAVVAVLAASFVAPVWVVLWGLKFAVGLLFGLIAVVKLAVQRPRVRVAAVVTLFVVVGFSAFLDPTALAKANNRFNQRGKADVDTSVSPAPQTTHLVLGASMVNGAALAHGAYGDGALDQVLARECSAPDRTWARYALDGGSACFMRDMWRDTSSSLPALKDRSFFGGFNDDMTAPASRVGVWVSTAVAVLPNSDPRPRAHAVWQMAAEANLRDARVDDLMECLGDVARDAPHAPLTHVYELGTFDLGRARRFGRERWAAERQKTVEAAGGRFVDIRALLPGESPIYFNDFSHLSEVGYATVARSFCEDDRLDPTPGCQ